MVSVKSSVCFRVFWITSGLSRNECIHVLTVSRCVRWCFALSLELLNAFWQPGCWHRYGFSPVWLRRWIFRFSRREKALLHPSNWQRDNNSNLSWRTTFYKALPLICAWVWTMHSDKHLNQKRNSDSLAHFHGLANQNSLKLQIIKDWLLCHAPSNYTFS